MSKTDIEQLQAKLKLAEEMVAECRDRLIGIKEIKKWEPMKGKYTINVLGEVINARCDESNGGFGMERNSIEEANKALIEMRKFNRLLAYRDEFAPDYEYKSYQRNYCVFYCHAIGAWGYREDSGYQSVQVYMPEQVAIELCEKLNSGEVEL